MKTLHVCIAALLTLAIGHLNAQVTTRPYLRVGNTFLTPTMEELNYPADAEEWMEVTREGTNIGFGAQFLFPIKKTHIGFDIGYTNIFDNKAVHDQLDGGRGYIEKFRDKEYSLYFLVMVEKKFDNGLFLQAGTGPHLVRWDFENEFKNFRYPELNELYSNGDVYVAGAAEVALGYEFMLNDRVGLFVMGRVDVIFEYDVMIPVSLQLGVKL